MYVVRHLIILHFSVTSRALIGQLSGPYSTVRPLNFKAVFVAKLIRDLSPSAHNFYTK